MGYKFFYRTSAGYFQGYHQVTAPPFPGSRRGKMQLTHIRSLGEMRAKSVPLCYSTFEESSHPKHIAIGPQLQGLTQLFIVYSLQPWINL